MAQSRMQQGSNRMGGSRFAQFKLVLLGKHMIFNIKFVMVSEGYADGGFVSRRISSRQGS